MSYIEYDDFGMVKVCCMNCGEIVASRTYVSVPSRTNPNEMVNVLAFRRLGNWRQKRIDYDIDGKPYGYIDAILCAECETKQIDEDKIIGKFKDGLVKEKEAHGGRPDEVQKLKDSLAKVTKKGAK